MNTTPDSAVSNFPLPPRPDSGPVGTREGGIVQGGGYCAPSEPVIAEADLPTITVARGGLKFPTLEQRQAVEVFKITQHEKTKRAREVQSTIRVCFVLLLVLIFFLAAGDALPWQ